MKPVDLVILYEKALREIDVACAIKSLAERRGMTVEIVQQDYGYADALTRFRPKVVVLPYCYQQESNNIYLLRWRQAIFVNLSWEQLFYPGNRVAKTPRGEFALGHVIHHAWSRHYADMLAGLGVPPERVFLNGNLALALYQEPYRRYFKSRAELASRYGLDPARRWVFFPENYNWAFYGRQMLEQMVQHGQARQDVERMRDFATRSFEMAMAWCKRLVEEADVELVLRPRPATVTEEFAARVAETVGSIPPRLHILQDETVRDWILASDLVVSSYSTSLIEAAVAGKDILMLEPLPLPDTLRQVWHELAPRARDYADLAAALIGRAGDPKPLADWAREAMLSRGDPIAGCVDFFDRLCAGRIPRPPLPARTAITVAGRAPLPLAAWYAWRWLRTWLSLAKVRSPWRTLPAAEHRADLAAAAQIPARVARWHALFAAQPNVTTEASCAL